MKKAVLTKQVLFFNPVDEAEDFVKAEPGAEVIVLHRGSGGSVQLLYKGLTKWVHDSCFKESARMKEVEDHPIEDVFGDEICTDDSYYVFGKDTVNEVNLRRYLIEKLGIPCYRAI